MKRTKIVATISDKRCDVDFLQELYQAGMDVVRLNTAHQTLDDAMKVIRNVRAVSEKIPLLIDTKGPEVRTKQVTVPIEVEKGEVIYITGKEEVVSDEKLLHVSYENFTQDIKIGDKILVDDGDMEFIVQGKYEDRLEVMATNPGFIKDKKSVNVPGASMKLQSLSEKDRRFIEFAIEIISISLPTLLSGIKRMSSRYRKFWISIRVILR